MQLIQLDLLALFCFFKLFQSLFIMATFVGCFLLLQCAVRYFVDLHTNQSSAVPALIDLGLLCGSEESLFGTVNAAVTLDSCRF